MRLLSNGICSLNANISIHAPVKGATIIDRFIIVSLSYFNPRTREGCDFPVGVPVPVALRISIHAPVKGATRRRIDSPPAVYISIHAPVKGATRRVADLLLQVHISIHAPVKGATGQQLFQPFWQGNFNPRTREGCDWKSISTGAAGA